VTLRKLLMASAAIVSLSAAVSSAEAAQPYASIFGGLSFLQGQNMTGKNHTRTTTVITGSSTQSLDTSFKTGFVLGGNAGIEWGNGLRTELELAYRQHKSKKHAHLKTHYQYQFSTTTGEGSTITTRVTSGHSGEVPANLRMRAWSLMANAWYDFDLGLPVTPYVGGGIGLALVKISGQLGHFAGDGSTVVGTLFEKNDNVFAWQLGAGVSMPITDTVKAFVDYRYFAADDAHLMLEPGYHGGSINADFNSQSVMVGLRFNF
jgi:opacity protein-like surface antigen